MVALLLSGTLKLDFLTNTYFDFTLPIQGMDTLQDTLYRLIPFDPTRGEEGVSAQGLILIGLLLIIALFAWRGFEKIHDGANAWTWGAFGIIIFTLLVASTRMEPLAGGLKVMLTGRTAAVAIFMAYSDG